MRTALAAVDLYAHRIVHTRGVRFTFTDKGLSTPNESGTENEKYQLAKKIYDKHQIKFLLSVGVNGPR